MTFQPVLIVRAVVTPAIAASLVRARRRRPTVVVADRVSSGARDVLRKAGAGWLDRRGHVRVWAPGVRIETPTAPLGPHVPEDARGRLWGPVGLELAVWALCHPREPLRPRVVARELGRNPGYLSTMIGRFVDAGLVAARERLPLVPELFWATAEHWPAGWVHLAERPDVLDVDEQAMLRVGEWVDAGDDAASALGAPLFGSGLAPMLYVPDARTLRATADQLGVARGNRFAAAAQVAPVRHVPSTDLRGRAPWQLAHPAVCALELARDPARGREILADWTPDGGERVW